MSRPPFLRFACALFGATALARGVSQESRFTVHVGGYGPRTEVRYARPTLKWEIWPSDPQAKVRSVSLRLDGKPVDAKYDVRARAVQYTPTTPLSTGAHKVECTIVFDGGATFVQNWETRVAVSPLAEFPAPNNLQLKGLAAINALRAGVKLPPVEADDRMNLAALQHSLYLATNHVGGHEEEAGKPGYLAKTGAERLEAYGWIGGSWEDVNLGAIEIGESVRELFDAPYHRVPFLQPGTFAVGTGFEDSRLTVEFGMPADEGIVLSPAEGQKGIPCGWHNFESPNPLRFHGGAKRTGYPIVFAVFGPDMPKLNFVTATLTDANGTLVPCWLNSQDNDAFLTGAAVLFPQSPLKPSSRYTVNFSAKDDTGKPLQASSTFTTGPR